MRLMTNCVCESSPVTMLPTVRSAGVCGRGAARNVDGGEQREFRRDEVVKRDEVLGETRRDEVLG